MENVTEDNNFTNDEIKNLKKTINDLHENEHIEVFKIIKNDTDKFTENRNGIFINMSNLPYSTLLKLQKFVVFCNENKKSFQNNKDKMDTIKSMVSEENNDSYSNGDNESLEDIEINYHISKPEHYYRYSNNQEINFNDIENSLLKESFNILENEKIIKKKKKYSGVKGILLKKNRDNIISGNMSINTPNTYPIKVPLNISKSEENI